MFRCIYIIFRESFLTKRLDVGLNKVTKDILRNFSNQCTKVKFICICWFHHHIESD